jgi:hypothetical protein
MRFVDLIMMSPKQKLHDIIFNINKENSNKILYKWWRRRDIL